MKIRRNTRVLRMFLVSIFLLVSLVSCGDYCINDVGFQCTEEEHAEANDIPKPFDASLSFYGLGDSTSFLYNQVALHAKDNEGITGYYISENPSGIDFPSWTAVDSTTSFSLVTYNSFEFRERTSDQQRTLYAWFVNAFGNISGRTSASTVLTKLSPGHAKAVAVGDKHTCVIDDDDATKCWGKNDKGQVAPQDSSISNQYIGDDENEMEDNLEPIDFGAGLYATQLSMSGYSEHFCVLLNNGEIKCWGNNLFGQLGLGHNTDIWISADTMGDSLLSVDLGTNRTAKQFTIGEGVSCAILDNDLVKCWGYNRYGSLGQESTSDIGDEPGEMGDNLSTVDLGSGRTAKQISVGGKSVCVVLDNNSLKCWGSNFKGKLGQGHGYQIGIEPGEMGVNLAAIDLGTGRTVKQVVVGEYHICSILDDDTIKC